MARGLGLREGDVVRAEIKTWTAHGVEARQETVHLLRVSPHLTRGDVVLVGRGRRYRPVLLQGYDAERGEWTGWLPRIGRITFRVGTHEEA